MLFDAPVVTSVRLTVGAGTLFSFNTPPATPGAPDITINPTTGIDQVALDDFVYGEPTAIVVPTPVVAGGPSPASTGQTGVPCAGTAGQNCTVSGGVTGTWTEGTTHPFFLTTLGPAGTAPGSTPRVFLPTTAGVETFTCSPVGVVAPFNVVCSGSTIGDLLQGATVTIRVALFGGGFVDVTGTVSGPGPRRSHCSRRSGWSRLRASKAPSARIRRARPARPGRRDRQRHGQRQHALEPDGQRAGGCGRGYRPRGGVLDRPGSAGLPLRRGRRPGTTTVACTGTTAGNALQGSTVTVVFAPGVVSVGTINGPGGRSRS